MTNDDQTMELATALTVAWLENTHTRAAADDVPAFLSAVHKALSDISGTGTTAPQPAVDVADIHGDHTPAVSVRKSLASPDFIISMVDGKPYKTLRRHLTTNGMTPESYRERYKLPADYPMIAPSYAKARSELSKSLGLGRKKGQKSSKSIDAGDGVKADNKTRASFADATAAARRHLGD